MGWNINRMSRISIKGNEMLLKDTLTPNVTREVIRYENFVVIIPVLIK